MTVGQYLLASGTAGPTEQDTLDRLDEFMSGALGWNRLDVVADTASDNDRVWYSEGETPGEKPTIFARARANADKLQFYVYTNWLVGSGIGHNQLTHATNTTVTNNNSGGSDEYWFVGNKDAVFVSLLPNSLGGQVLGGFGYLNSFWSVAVDPYPAFVTGQAALADTYASVQRVFSYGFDPDGFLHLGSTYSGIGVGYVAQNVAGIVDTAAPNPRDNRLLMLKSHLYRERSRTDGIPGSISHENRGDLPAVFQISGLAVGAGNVLTASGVAAEGVPGNELGFGDFIVSRSNSANAYALGPITLWEPTPRSINDLELWLTSSAVQKQVSQNTVRAAIDLSGQGNEAVQTTTSLQPPIIDIFSNNIAGLDFNNNEYLTGSLEVVNDYTIFTVASYNTTGQTPIFYTRGVVGGNDTLFSVDFNTALANTAQITVRSDDSPSAEDVYRYSGLQINTPYIISLVSSGTSTILYLNGDADSSTEITNTKSTIAGSNTLNYGIGTTLDSAGSPSGGLRHNGAIAEVIVYSRALTNEEHQEVICYLGDKYALTVSGTC